MPKSNIFDRTAVFHVEKDTDGRKRMKRIPWDLIGFGNNGFFVSPMPISLNPLGETGTSTVVSDIQDMLIDEAQNDLIDEVVDTMFVESEQDFYSRFEGVFGFYTGNYTQSAEFGYPANSNLT